MADRDDVNWLTCEQFAEIAGMPVRTARYAIARAREGKPVARWPIEVRCAAGRGGRAGLRYEVNAKSLPRPFRNELEGVSAFADAATLPPPVPRQLAKQQGGRIEHKLRVIDDALSHPRGSSERADAVALAARKHHVGERTIQRWIADYEGADFDLSQLGRRRPSDAGMKRVAVSRRFDRAFREAGGSEERLWQLGSHMDRLVKAGWASIGRCGKHRVRLEVVTQFKRECRLAGIELPDNAYDVSLRRIEDARAYSVVDLRRHDRKAFDDSKPRIRRNNALYPPMAEAVVDVTPIDVAVCRPDGSIAFPRLVGFLDTGTQRMFFRVFLLPKGEGIRQEHVIATLLDMIDDPDWGVPQRIYMDNGSENLRLVKLKLLMDMISEAGVRTIVRTKAYQGASKPIESRFAVMNRFVVSAMPGWAGGNRILKKVETLGHGVTPYPGDFDAFATDFALRMIDWEAQPIKSGPFRGRSPRQVYHDHLDSGWRPVTADRAALDQAFSEHITRKVDRGAVSIEGERYRHPNLPDRQAVSIAIPYRRGAYPLVKLPDLGWAYLEPEILHLPGDIAGAIESGRAQARDGRRATRMAREVGTLDLTANVNDRVTALPTRAAAAPLIDVMLSNEAMAMAAARQQADQRAISAPSEDERRRARIMRETEERERRYGRVG